MSIGLTIESESTIRKRPHTPSCPYFGHPARRSSTTCEKDDRKATLSARSFCALKLRTGPCVVEACGPFSSLVGKPLVSFRREKEDRMHFATLEPPLWCERRYR